MLRQYNPSSFYVGQGCDLRLFDATVKHPVPPDVPTGSGPVIGYVGALKSLRLDISTLLKIARERPEWKLVLVGPEDEDFLQSELHRLPNVYFTGKKEVPELPAYVQSFDVCINPQILNVVTVGNYPLKIDEYLAMGKPVVATATKTMELFRDYVYLAATPDDYIPLIEKALSENTDSLTARRIQFAGTHTWENSVAAIYQAILTTPGN
nr:glycosyltransferase [Chitinophaga hostae]